MSMNNKCQMQIACMLEKFEHAGLLHRVEYAVEQFSSRAHALEALNEAEFNLSLTLSPYERGEWEIMKAAAEAYLSGFTFQ